MAAQTTTFTDKKYIKVNTDNWGNAGGHGWIPTCVIV